MKKMQLIHLLTVVLSACGSTLNKSDFSNRTALETTATETIATHSPQQATSMFHNSPTVLIERSEVPFEVCTESKDWTRPSEEKQDQAWWSNGRYAGVDKSIIEYYWNHNFLIDYGNAVDAFDNINLSGLWLDAENLSQCLGDTDHTHSLVNGDKSRIWLLSYRVSSVTRAGQTLNIEIEPTNKGYQIILIPRHTKKPLTLTFQDTAGKEFDSIREDTAPFAYPWATE